MDIALSWDYTEDFVAEDDLLRALRATAVELGADPIPASVGAQLALHARATSARAVFEVGTGCGVSSLYLLRAMPAAGVLTSADLEPEYHRVARQAFAQAGVASPQTRLFTGNALDLMPRMNSAAYDLVILDGDPAEVTEYLPHALRMLRSGGSLICVHALASGRVADPTRRDAAAVAMRQILRELKESPDFLVALSPVSDGLLTAVKR